MTLVDTDLQGQAEEWDDDALLLLILLFLTDAPRAVVVWDSLVPARYRGLLNAVPIPNARVYQASGQAFPPVWFDEYAQRYGLSSRGYIAPKGIVDALEAFRTAAMAQATSSIAPVYAGTVDVGRWQNEFADDLRMIALAAALYAVGGTARLKERHLRQVRKALRFQMGKLENFAVEIAAGRVNEVRGAQRAGMYPNSVITNIYHEIRRAAHVEVGFLTEENILDPDADHCEPKEGEPPDCPSITALGPQSIGSLTPIGERRCLWNCRCHWEFSREPV
jgi:hypothetical protein